MDEVLFRSSQKIENMQMRAELTAAKVKDLFILYTHQGKVMILNMWNGSTAEEIRANLRELFTRIITTAKNIQQRVMHYANPRLIFRQLHKVFGKKWTKRDIYFGCAGFLIGAAIGIAVGLAWRTKEPSLRFMKAIQCHHYSGTESITVVEDALAPYQCGDYDVLINVKAASVQVIDAQICSGYGRVLRKILQRIYKQSNSGLPVILGRDCTGIVTDIGCKVKRFEVGDEVWLTVPFWSQGTLCQSILVSENRVSKKPKNIGFEGACSLPYAGSLALSALGEANIDLSTAPNKNILIQGGCTPVGCVLVQLLNHWRADVTTTCYRRAVPVVKALGASEIISIAEPDSSKSKTEKEYPEVLQDSLLKQLELKNTTYDVIISTSCDCNYNVDDLNRFCKANGTIISTLPPILMSDSCGYFSGCMLSWYIYLKHKFQNLLGLPMSDFDETHLCYVTLDRLAEFVEDGYVQTVVDKVFQPQDIELAIHHIQTSESIGSTVVTFR